MKWKRLLVLATIIGLTYLFWPTPVRPTILSAYSDSFAGIWALDLYRDGSFHLSLPAAEAKGSYKLKGDTIMLNYIPSAPQLPKAYLINQPKKRLDELQVVAGRMRVLDNSNWMALQQAP